MGYRAQISVAIENAISPPSRHCGHGLAIDGSLFEELGAPAKQHLRAAIHQLFDNGSGPTVISRIIEAGRLRYAVIGAAQHFLGAFAASRRDMRKERRGCRVGQ